LTSRIFSTENTTSLDVSGAPLVVIGAPLAVADYDLKPGADADTLFTTIKSFVDRVKGRAS